MSLVPPSLRLLLRLRAKGFWRRVSGRLGRKRSIIPMVLGGLVLIGWTMSVVVSAFSRESRPHVLPASSFGPLMLTAMGVLGPILGRGSVITFSPAEIDFLFPGPFTRRQLVAYRLMQRMVSTGLGAALFTVFLGGAAPHPGFALIALVLAFWCTDLCGLAISTVLQAASRRIGIAARGVALALVAGGAGLIALTMPPARPGDPLGLLTRVNESAAGRVLLAPAGVFFHAFEAESAADFLPWIAGGAALVAGVFAQIIWSDALDMEAAIATSRRASERAARAARGDAVPVRVGARGFSLPDPPRLWGAGPIAWRQATALVRTSVAQLALLLLAMVGFPIFFARLGGDEAAGVLAPLIPLAVLFVPQLVRFDFRNDVDTIPWLKSLPLSPRAVAFGQLAIPTLVATAAAWAACATCAIVTRANTTLLATVAVLAPPGAFMILIVENFMYLLFPFRHQVHSPLDIQAVGRGMMVTLGKLGLIGAAGAITAGLGWAAWGMTHSWLATIATCWIVLAGIAVLACELVAWAFDRFDAARDTPV